MKTIDELIYNNHGNYKEYLTLKSKTAKSELNNFNTRISSQKKELKRIIEKRELQIEELSFWRDRCKDDIKSVSAEYSYRRKINSLLKKHSYLSVLWDGDGDVYTTWVYSADFDGDKDYVGDPFQDEPFCDSYEEAYERCLDYIKYHETN